MLEGTLRGGIRPGTLTAECFHATLGGAEHRVFDLATGIGDEQVELGSGGNVEHESVRLYVAIVQGQRSLAPGARVSLQIGICLLCQILQHVELLSEHVGGVKVCRLFECIVVKHSDHFSSL